MSAHDLSDAVVVAVEVGKNVFAVSATDGRRRGLLGPLEAPMTWTGMRSRGSSPSCRPGHRSGSGSRQPATTTCPFSQIPAGRPGGRCCS